MNEQNLSYRKRKLQWHARRGLLELDVFIQPFIQEHLAAMGEDEVTALEALFSHEDPDLWKMFLHPEATKTVETLSPKSHALLLAITQSNPQPQ